MEIYLVALAILIWMAIAVWEDAKKRGLAPMGWALLVLFLGPVGVAVYMIVRNDRRPK